MTLKREASTRSALAPSLDDDESSTGSIYTTCDPLSDPEADDLRRTRRELRASTRQFSSSSLSLSQRSLRTMTRIHQLLESPSREAPAPSGRLWSENRAASDYEDHNIYLNDVSEDASESSILDYIITAAEAGRSKAADYDDTETDETAYSEFTRQTSFDGRSKQSFRHKSNRSRSARRFPRLLTACLIFLLVMVAIVGVDLVVGQVLPRLRQLFTNAGAESVLHSPNDTTISDPVTTLPELSGTTSTPIRPEPHRPLPSPYFGEAESSVATVGPTPAPSSFGLGSSDGSSSEFPETASSASETPQNAPWSTCEDSDDSFWFQIQVVEGASVMRNCEWLRNQSELERAARCGDAASSANIHCRLTCGAC